MRRMSLSLFYASSTIYLLSAFVGVWAAGNGTAAWERFALFMVAIAGVLLMVVVSNRHGVSNSSHSKWYGLAGLTGAFAATVIAVNFVVTESMPSEVAAASFVILIPIGAVGLMWANQQQWPRLTLVVSASLGIAILGLVLTLERSAWLALVVGCTFALFCHGYFSLDRNMPEHSVARRLFNRFILIGVLLLMVSTIVLVITPSSRQFLSNLIGSSPYSRLSIWQDALTVIQDYRFTGSGLGQTSMVLSTYVYLFHVPFLFQVYNLFIQIGIEQGIPGIIGFTGMILASVLKVAVVYRERQPAMRWFCTAALAALVGLLVHGMLDAGLYISRLMPLMFIPLGIAMILPTSLHHEQAQMWGLSWRHSVVVGILLPVAALTAVSLLPGSLSAWQANLGAVEQSRLELNAYEWPRWPIQDELRRSDSIDLSGAVVHYQLALQLDPKNSTAHRRLGQIALSQGNYDVARQHLQIAFELAPEQRVTRQLLGELYAVSGEVGHAVDVWESGDTDPHKLELRQWWYTYLGADQQAHWLDEAVALYKDLLKRRS